MIRRGMAALVALALLGGGPEALGAAPAPPPPPPPAPAPAPTPRPTSEDALTERALQALAGDDAAAYLALLATADELAAWCPKQTRRRAESELARVHAQVRHGVASCHRRVPWARATRIAVAGGRARRPVEGCREALRAVEDIRLTYEADGRRWQVRLAAPFTVGGERFGFTARPTCEELPRP